MKVLKRIALIGVVLATVYLFGYGSYLEVCYLPARRDKELMPYVWTAEKEFVARTGRSADSGRGPAYSSTTI